MNNYFTSTSNQIEEADKQEMESSQRVFDKMFNESDSEVSPEVDPSGQGNDSLDDEISKDESQEQNDKMEAEEPPNGKKPQSQLLVDMALSSASFFHTPDDEPFAAIKVDDHYENHPINGNGFKKWLSHSFYKEFKKGPGSQARKDALGLLEAKAKFDGPEREVHVRFAEHSGNVYIDIADTEWNQIEITPDGWSIIAVSDSPVVFKRTKGMLPLAKPINGEPLEPFRLIL